MTNPKEPTLTCSEVVERLVREAMTCDDETQWLDPTKAEAILHSWRERRVQELEELLRFALDVSDSSSSPVHPDRIGEWREKAEKLLANSEQIRKGAK